MDIELFSPYQKQKQVIDGFIDSDQLFGVVVAPRGSGKSLLGMNMLLYWALAGPKRKTAWISPIYNQGKSIYDQIVEAAKDVIIANNRQDLLITFVNGSTVKFLSTDNMDTIRGFRFSHMVIDEMAFMKELAIEQVVLPTLNPSGKKCLIISTPKGKNFFYNWFIRGQQGDGSVVSYRIQLDECPYVNSDLIESARKSLPPDLFKQEYEAQFVDSSNDVFIGTNKVAILNNYEEARGQDAFVGIDTGLTSDMSVLTLISPIGKVLVMDAINNMNIQDIAQRYMNIMSNYNIVGGNIESNGIGRGMVDLITPKFRKVRPFNTSQDSKTEIVRKLINDIETQTIELPTEELCPELHKEFANYSYKLSSTGKLSFGHISGAHDDYLDSLMLANYSRVQFMDRKSMTVQGSPITVKPKFGGGLPR